MCDRPPPDVNRGEALYESGGQLSHVYFPTDSIISLLYVMESGASARGLRYGLTWFV
jgi:hypothetical protein